jgi:hypothetical protein
MGVGVTGFAYLTAAGRRWESSANLDGDDHRLEFAVIPMFP